MTLQVPVSLKPNGDIYLDEGVLELYIWKNYVEKGYTNISGTMVESLGLLPLRWYRSVNSDKPTLCATWDIPTQVIFSPSNTDMKKVKIYPTSDEKEYVVIRFEKGDRIMNNNVVKSLDNVVQFTQMVLGKGLDNNIPYPLLTPGWIRNMIMNDVNLNVPVTNIDNIIANLCRYKKDPNKTFASVIGKNPNTPMTDYIFVDTRTVCATDSIFGALSFEDMNLMLDSSLNMTQQEREQRVSPVEAIIKL